MFAITSDISNTDVFTFAAFVLRVTFLKDPFDFRRYTIMIEMNAFVIIDEEIVIECRERGEDMRTIHGFDRIDFDRRRAFKLERIENVDRMNRQNEKHGQ